MKRTLTACLCLMLCVAMLSGCRRRIRRRHRTEPPQQAIAVVIQEYEFR